MNLTRKYETQYKVRQGDRFLDLDEAQNILLLTLEKLDKLCKANDITFFLMWGSFLGAVRHQNIIPWDDDVDIAVNKSDFIKLRNLIHNGKLEDLVAYSHLNTKNYPTNELRFSIPGYYRLAKAGRKTYKTPLCIDVFWYEPLTVDETENKRRLKKLRFASERLNFKNIHYPARSALRYTLRQLIKPFLIWPSQKQLHNSFERSGKEPQSESKVWFPSTAYNNRIIAFNTSDFAGNLELRQFGHLELPTPKSEALLEQIYGKNWRVPLDRSNGQTKAEVFVFIKDETTLN